MSLHLPPHVAEEIENASTVIPRAMITAVSINGALGLGILIAALFSISNLQDVIETPTGYPFMEIFVQAMGSARGATGLVSLPGPASSFAHILTTTGRHHSFRHHMRDEWVPGYVVPDALGVCS